MPIQVFSGSLTRPMPQYGAANRRGITRYLFDDRSGKLEIVGETSGIDYTGWLVLDAKVQRLYATCQISGTD